LWLLSACGSSSDSQALVIHRQQGDPIRVTVEIVYTPEQRSFGLMYRQELPAFHGMLFLFPREEPLSFWMKNTPLSLDILYINATHTIVSIARNTVPFSEQLIPSGSPAQFVLEVNGGFSQQQRVAVGDRVEFPEHLPRPS
jgi:uncharacterized membrane protein (UPF0127 family)